MGGELTLVMALLWVLERSSTSSLTWRGVCAVSTRRRGEAEGEAEAEGEGEAEQVRAAWGCGPSLLAPRRGRRVHCAVLLSIQRAGAGRRGLV